jgi:hypothetical protein
MLVLLASQTGTIFSLFALVFVGVQKFCGLRPDSDEKNDNPLMKSEDQEPKDNDSESVNMRKFSEPLLRAHRGSLDMKFM